MEYLLALLIFAGMYALTTILSGFFGLLIPIIYLFLGFILGIESTIIGIGGILGSLLNIYLINIYIREEGAMSSGPHHAKLASWGYVIIFILTIIFKYIFKFDFSDINYWYLVLLFFVTSVLCVKFMFFQAKQRPKDFKDLKEGVLSYKIIKKYDTNPKWAIYLYYKDGFECWNQTIPYSFLAKDPKNDFTFVFNTKKEALKHAKNIFSESNYID